MIELNLNATTPEQEKIKAYLQNNVSEILAEKINNGVQIVKDGKTLLNKKTLNSFMEYANAEARKIAAKGSKCACIDDETVYGWAIHYFEENSIEGTLYKADGTEYKTQAPKPTATITAKQPFEQPKPQMSIFDMVNNTAESAAPEIAEQPDSNEDAELIDNDDTNDEVDEETDNEQPAPEELEEIYSNEQEPFNEPVLEQATIKQYYQCYLNIQEMYKDSIIAYRLGDFFEIFGENAKLIADELNMTLTGRDVGLKERVPMIGIPFHDLDAYISKIISKGHKLAVVEPQGEIQTFEPTKQPEQKTNFNSSVQTEDDTLMREREIAKAFDQNALIILSDILGDIFIME